MGYKRVIQLRGLKDKVSKRYFVNIRFHHKGKFLFESRYDIHDLVIDNGWKSISSTETMAIFPALFGIYTGKYPLLNREYSDRTGHWLVKEEWGFSISLLYEDLATIRNKKIKDLGV
jgi:hypothetical protein